jgi:hypothetical protein
MAAFIRPPAPVCLSKKGDACPNAGAPCIETKASFGYCFIILKLVFSPAALVTIT